MELGRFITGTEAQDLADLLSGGEPLGTAIETAVSAPRRARIQELLTMSGHNDPESTLEAILGLRIAQGAYARTKDIATVWTVPMGLARIGELNSSRRHLVANARTSIVCSTYNFQRSSALWEALQEASTRPGVSIRIYVDAEATQHDGVPDANSPSPEQIAQEIHGARVFRTIRDETGRYYRNHAKFLSADHQILLVTSANFSYSAEERNIELGLRIHDESIAEAVEQQMRSLEPHLYEQVYARMEEN